MNSTRERLLASSILGGAILMALTFTGAAQAQTAAAKAAAATEVEEIVVTGSLFRRTDTETPSPVTVMTTEALQAAGITTAADAIRSVSADGAGSIGTGFQSGFSGGGAAVSLRGLGVSSTLILVDGLRSTNFPISDDGHNSYVDLNSIPFSMLSSIEVLKDGANSLYGADAIGGVVNLKMRKTFKGWKGELEGGQSSRGDAEHSRAELAFGFGDYDEQGFNFYVGAEYQKDGRVSNHSRGFPYNTLDLSSIGGQDLNTADSSPTTVTPSAMVARVRQTDLNNPLAGGAGAPLSNYQLLNPTCPNGTYTAANITGFGCKYDLEDQYLQIQPLQTRYAYTARFSFKLTDNIEGYVTGAYSNNFVSIRSNIPRTIRETSIFGGNPAVSASVPGIVLPVYICATGVNCATAPDRRLNPNNPFAGAFANDPSNGAARIYYRFGDLLSGSDRSNEVIRGAAGLQGSFDKWNWKIDAVAARDNLQLTDYGYLNVAGLLNAINTGSYNFVNPSSNTTAVRNAVSPNVVTPSNSQMLSLDGSVTRDLWELPGGPVQLALGAQVRREELVNNTRVPRLDIFGLNVAQSYGQHTVKAGFFEVLAPISKQLEVNVSGRYDSYSEGFSHFSPKVGVKWTPLKELAFRGTFSEGFRAPTFAESGARSQYPGFSNFTPPAAFQLQHGGLTSAGNANPYAQAYRSAQGAAGNPALEPEISRSFTLGIIAQPVRWLSATVDYYKVKKEGLVVSGPLGGAARNAYYSQSTSAAGCAAVAAVGTGYSCNLLDGPDPLFPNAMPRVLIINVPFVNANALEDQGVDFSATVVRDLPYDTKWTSKVETTYVIQHDLITSAGVQKYAGTLGPYELSSGNGTPKIRGNWQNTLKSGRYSLSATAYYVGRIKAVATDEGNLSTDCSASLYVEPKPQPDFNKFCYVKRFVSVDLNGSAEIREGLKLYANIGNVFDARAPIDPAGYTSSPNFMTTWHYAGVIGRTYKVGVKFEF